MRFNGFRKPSQGVNVSSGAHRDALFTTDIPDLSAFTLHQRPQPFMDILHWPVETLPVLDPLEVRNGNAPGICQNVGKHHGSVRLEDCIRPWSDRPVGQLKQQSRFHRASVVLVDHVLEGRWDQQVAVGSNEVVSLYPLVASLTRSARNGLPVCLSVKE